MSHRGAGSGAESRGKTVKVGQQLHSWKHQAEKWISMHNSAHPVPKQPRFPGISSTPVSASFSICSACSKSRALMCSSRCRSKGVRGLARQTLRSSLKFCILSSSPNHSDELKCFKIRGLARWQVKVLIARLLI